MVLPLVRPGIGFRDPNRTYPDPAKVVTIDPGATYTNTDQVLGGNGDGSNGGDIGVWLEAGATLTNSGTIAGGNSVSGNWADGGVGVVANNGGTIVNSGLIRGGTAGAVGVLSAYGGTGAQVVNGAALTNTGTIIGGAGGVNFYDWYNFNPHPVGLACGDGVYLDGGTLTNGGTIAGGTGVNTTDPRPDVFFFFVNPPTPGTPGAAVAFGASASTLVVESGAVFVGTVAANGVNDTLVLGGADPGTFTGLGTQFTGFSTLTVAAGATWTLPGSLAVTAGMVLDDYGTFTVPSGITLAGQALIGPTASLDADVNVLAGGTITVMGGATIDPSRVYANYGGSRVILAGSAAPFTIDGLGIEGFSTFSYIDVASDATVTLTANVLPPFIAGPNGTTLSVAGTVTTTDPLVNFGGNTDITSSGTFIGPISVQGGLVTNAGTIENNGAAAAVTIRRGTVISSGLIDGGTGAAVSFGELPVDFPGTLVLHQGAQIAGSITAVTTNGALVLGDATDGTLTGLQVDGVIAASVASGATWTLAGTSGLGAGTTLTDDGLLSIGGDFTGAGSITVAAGKLVVTSGGQATIAAGGSASGSLDVATGGTLGVPGTVTGTVTDAGLVTVAAGGTLGGTVNVLPDAALDVSGTVTGTVTDDGSVTVESGGSVDGTTTVSGSLTVAAGGTLGGGVSVTGTGVLDVAGAVTASVTDAATVTVATGGSLGGTTNVTSAGSLSVAGTVTGTVNDAGAVTIGAGGEVDGAIDVAAGGTLTVIAGATVDPTQISGAYGGSRLILTGSGAQIVIDGLGSAGYGSFSHIDVASDADVSLTATMLPSIIGGPNGTTLTVAGTLTTTDKLVNLGGETDVTSSGTIIGPVSVQDGLVTNAGTMANDGGAAAVTIRRGTVVSSGTIDGGSGAAVAFGELSVDLPGTLVLHQGARLIGGITAVTTNGVLVLGDATDGTLTGLQVTGTVSADVAQGATWTLAGASVLGGGTTLTDEGMLTMGGSLTCTGPIQVTTGTLTVAGTVTGDVTDDNLATIAAGGSVAGTVTVAAGGSLNVLGVAAGLLNTSGTTTIAAGGSLFGSAVVSSGGTLDVAGAVTGNLTTAGGVTIEAGASLSGIANVSSGGSLDVSGSITGTVIAAGAVGIEAAGSLTGNALVSAGGSLGLAGKITGDVTSIGTVNLQAGASMSGTLSVNGGGSASIAGSLTGALLVNGLYYFIPTVLQAGARIAGVTSVGSLTALRDNGASLTGTVSNYGTIRSTTGLHLAGTLDNHLYMYGGSGGVGIAGTAAVIFSGVSVGTNAYLITGGYGGDAGATVGAGAGGASIDFTNATGTLTNSQFLLGGNGGNTANPALASLPASSQPDGANGGDGVLLGSGATLINTGFVSGGFGGGQILSGKAGGTGGTGVVAAGAGATVNNRARIDGGGGGLAYSLNGFVNPASSSGDGGVGVLLGAGATMTNAGTITGGNGGQVNNNPYAAANPLSTGGAGGAGAVIGAGASLSNSGTIAGGNGAVKYVLVGGYYTGVYVSKSGTGVVLAGGSLTTSGRVAGGVGVGSPVALTCTDGRSVLTILPGASFTGAVQGNNLGATLAVSNPSGAGGALTGLGTQFTGWNTLAFDKNWSMSGLASAFSGGQTITGFGAGNRITLTDYAAASATVGAGGVGLSNATSTLGLLTGDPGTAYTLAWKADSTATTLSGIGYLGTPGIIAQTAGGGTLGGTAANGTLDLGAIRAGSATVSLGFAAGNSIASLLSGGLSATGAFGASGFGAFSGLGAGQLAAGGTLTLSTGALGVFTETLVLAGTAAVAEGTAILTPETLTVTGTVTGIAIGSTPGTYANTGGPATFLTTAGGLQAGSVIQGGSGGSDWLLLSGGGSFNLAAPTRLTNISRVLAFEGSGSASQTVTLRNRLNMTVDVSGGSASDSITLIGARDQSVFNLGNGTDTVVLGARTETVNVGGGRALISATAATAGALIANSTADRTTLTVTGGGKTVLNANDTNLTVVLGTGTSLALGKLGFITVDASAGKSTVIAKGANQVLIAGPSDRLSGAVVGNDTFVGRLSDLTSTVIRNWTTGDVLDVGGLNAATLHALSYANGRLALSDGSASGRVAIFGTTGSTLTASNFTVLGSDGHGGVLIGWHG